jgi:arsenate reductase
MAQLKVYIYAKCSTCRNALKWLDENGLSYETAPIRETPPSPAELERALKGTGNIRKLLNTSSQDYRDLGLKDRLDALSTTEIFALLQDNGNLVKRPFVVTGNSAFAGFKADEWADRLL